PPPHRYGVRAITLPASMIWRTAVGASSGGRAMPFGSAVASCTPSPAVLGRERARSSGAATRARAGAEAAGTAEEPEAGAEDAGARLAAAAPPATGSTTVGE